MSFRFAVLLGNEGGMSQFWGDTRHSQTEPWGACAITLIRSITNVREYEWLLVQELT